MSKKILFIFCIVIAIVISALALPKILVMQGKQCYKKGDMACATECFKNAHTILPSSLEYEYYYTKALSKSKSNYKTQKEMYNLYKKAKSKSAKSLAKSTLNHWKSSIINRIGNNYIEQTPSDADIVRWSKESFPLKVCTRQEVGVPEYYNYAIKRAFALWSKSISFVDFKPTNNCDAAQIVIEIKQLPANTCVNGVCKYVTGYTTPIRSAHQLKKMAIVLYDKDPSGTYFTDKDIFHTISHELGHALGIMGHSYSRDDLMYTTQHDKNNIYEKYRTDIHALSGRDVNTIELLYMLEPTVTDRVSNNSNLIYPPIVLGDRDAMLDRKIKEAQDYIKASPNLSTGYIDLASAYMQKGNKKTAESILLQGLNHTKSNDETYIIFYNLALVTCSDKQFSKAREYLNKAKAIKNMPELSELEYFITNKIVPSL